MTQVSASVGRAAQWARGASVLPEEWNPVYRALEGAPATDSPGVPEPAALALVLRQLTAPALLVVAVTDGARTCRLRIGLDPVTATFERSDGDRPSLWSAADAQEVPTRITGMLEEAGADLAPAQLSVLHDADARRLTPEQSRIAADALAGGLSPEQAYARVPGLDRSLRDALSASGPRISLALTLHDPERRVTEEPVTWSRLWVTGRQGVYRLDQPTSPALRVQAVSGGDVLGTVLPILEQGLRFAAACATSGRAR